MSSAFAEEPKLLPPILHTLQDLRHLPGYAGFRPQIKWRYGDTFGNDTAKYFQQKRSIKLASSVNKELGIDWDKKVKFPTVYSNNPNLVLGARARDGSRILATPKYALLNRHERDVDIRDFVMKAQQHRYHYVDKSGTVPRVDYFVLPTKNDNQSLPPLRDSKHSQISGRDQVSTLCPLCGRKANQPVPDFGDFIRGHHQTSHVLCPPKSTWRDRQVRDVYFERR